MRRKLAKMSSIEIRACDSRTLLPVETREACEVDFAANEHFVVTVLVQCELPHLMRKLLDDAVRLFPEKLLCDRQDFQVINHALVTDFVHRLVMCRIAAENDDNLDNRCIELSHGSDVAEKSSQPEPIRSGVRARNARFGMSTSSFESILSERTDFVPTVIPTPDNPDTRCRCVVGIM